MITDKQIEANRRNARLATGPRTREGKARAAENAAKNWLFSERVLLPTEDPKEYHAFREDLWDAYDPHSIDECRLVGQICDGEWRLRRSLVYETACLTKLEFDGLTNERKQIGMAIAKTPTPELTQQDAMLARLEARLKIGTPFNTGLAFSSDSRHQLDLSRVLKLIRQLTQDINTAASMLAKLRRERGPQDTDADGTTDGMDGPAPDSPPGVVPSDAHTELAS